jgi:hypothetical protein
MHVQPPHEERRPPAAPQMKAGNGRRQSQLRHGFTEGVPVRRPHSQGIRSEVRVYVKKAGGDSGSRSHCAVREAQGSTRRTAVTHVWSVGSPKGVRRPVRRPPARMASCQVVGGAGRTDDSGSRANSWRRLYGRLEKRRLQECVL